MQTTEWLDGRARVLVGFLAARGLTTSPEVARMIVLDHLLPLMLDESAARVYLDDEVLQSLADSACESLAVEAPGADLHTLPRTASISVAVAGRALSALAESLLVYVDHGPLDDLVESPVREITTALSLLGFFIAEAHGPSIALPSAFLFRAARYLDTAADHPAAAAELVAALRREAMRLRAAAD